MARPANRSPSVEPRTVETVKTCAVPHPETKGKLRPANSRVQEPQSCCNIQQPWAPDDIRLIFAYRATISPIMARRSRPPDDVLSRKDLAELQRRLSMMNVTAVQDFYRSAHFVCRIGPGHFPSARAIQELVQAWKQMRRWR